METEDAERVEAMRRDLRLLAGELSQACGELETMIAAGDMTRLCVTAKLNQICKMKRRREDMLIELARYSMKEGMSHVD